MAQSRAAASKSRVEQKEEIKKEVKQEVSILGQKDIIRLEPIVRDRGHLHKNKDTQFLSEGCHITYMLATSLRTKSVINPFGSMELSKDDVGKFDRPLTPEELSEIAEK